MKVNVPFDQAVLAFPEAENALKAWRGRDLKGNDVDWRLHWYQWLPRSAVSNLVEDIVKSTDLTGPELIFERREWERTGPYSWQPGWADRVDMLPLEDFFGKRKFKPIKKYWDRAVQRVRDLIPGGSLHRLSIDEAAEQLPRSSSSGLPFFRKYRVVFDKEVARAKALDRGEIELEPFVAGWRGQPGGPEMTDVKQRLIWMSVQAEAIVSKTYMEPVQAALSSRLEFAAWKDLASVGTAMYELFTRARGREIVSTDYEAYDSTIPAQVLETVFDLLEYWHAETSPGFEAIKEHFIYGDLLTPDGLLTGREGGVPSGAGVTQGGGSIANMLFSVYAAECMQVEWLGGTFLGDDAVNVYSRFSVNEIVDCLSDVNLRQNEEKQYVDSEAIHYLSSVWSKIRSVGRDIPGVRPLHRVANGMMSVERFRNPKEFTRAVEAVGQIMKMENAIHHPGFQKFVAFAREGDEFLRKNPNRLLNRAGGVAGIEEVLGLAAFRYTSRDPERFNEFETVKLLREAL